MYAALYRPASFQGKGGSGKKGRVSSRVHEKQFCVSPVTKQIFTFSRFSKIEVVQYVKNVMLVPFCKRECFNSITRVYEPINSQQKPAVGEPDATKV